MILLKIRWDTSWYIYSGYQVQLVNCVHQSSVVEREKRMIRQCDVCVFQGCEKEHRNCESESKAFSFFVDVKIRCVVHRCSFECLEEQPQLYDEHMKRSDWL